MLLDDGHADGDGPGAGVGVEHHAAGRRHRGHPLPTHHRPSGSQGVGGRPGEWVGWLSVWYLDVYLAESMGWLAGRAVGFFGGSLTDWLVD